MKIVSVNVSRSKGTVKLPVPEAFFREGAGICGDAHSQSGIREVSLLSVESIAKMKGVVDGIGPGSFAENLTTQGLELHTLPLGTRIAAGDTELVVTKIGKECHSGCEISQKTGRCIMPLEGIFAKIVKSGVVRPGDGLRLID